MVAESAGKWQIHNTQHKLDVITFIVIVDIKYVQTLIQRQSNEHECGTRSTGKLMRLASEKSM